MFKKLIYIFSPIFIAITIFYLSSKSRIPDAASEVDKVVHFIAYFCLALMTVRALHYKIKYPIILLCAAGVLATLYGVSDEIHQRFVPGRSFSYLDMVADASGAWIAAWFYIDWRKTFYADHFLSK